ncbi:MAG: DUF1648 domain-containing protein [Dehalococcoidales bacterium]
MATINPSDSIVKTEPENKPRFRWIYAGLPLGLLALSIILAAVFYGKLTPEIAYHFNGDTPDRWFSRSAFLVWMLTPQVLFTVLSLAIVRMMMLGARYWPQDNTPLRRLLPLMGNIMALPQVIIFIAMLQFFLYNAYQTRPVPLWIIALAILLAGGIFLAVFFLRIIRQARRQNKTLRE